MRLVFLGDIGIDGPLEPEAAGLPAFDDADLVVANLEGAILAPETRAGLRRRRHVAVHNDPAVIDVLKSLNIGVVGLANNHTFDYDAPIGSTVRALEDEGIASFGAGAELAEAAVPYRFDVGGVRGQLFAFGWEMIGCRQAAAGRAGVNPMRPAHALETARRARREDPDALIIFLMHWNYELELYPQPAHRQLAHDLIGAGVDAVIGGHPHVAEGIEIVDGRPICYSLGNWLFPHRNLDGFQVAYPSVSRRELAVELDVEGREIRGVRLRWYDFDPNRVRLEAEAVENVSLDEGRSSRCVAETSIADRLTPYAGLEPAEYVDWFRVHRTRARGLPLYADYRARTNIGRNVWLRLRQAAGEALARLGLKREQRSRSGPSTSPAADGGGGD